MTPTRSLPAITLPLLFAMTACESGPEAGATAQLSEAAPEIIEATEATEVVAPSQAVSPIHDRDARERAEFEAAISGLRFDHGVVEIATPLAADANAARAQIEIGDGFLLRNQETEAIAAYATAVRHAPDVAGNYVKLGDSLKIKSKMEMAGAAYRTAIALEPDLVEPRYELAMAHWAELESDEAIATMEQLVVVDPANGAAHERLAIWNYYAGDYGAAWRHVHEARRLGHDVPPQFTPLLEARMADPRSGLGTP